MNSKSPITIQKMGLRTGQNLAIALGDGGSSCHPRRSPPDLRRLDGSGGGGGSGGAGVRPGGGDDLRDADVAAVAALLDAKLADKVGGEAEDERGQAVAGPDRERWA